MSNRSKFYASQAKANANQRGALQAAKVAAHGPAKGRTPSKGVPAASRPGNSISGPAADPTAAAPAPGLTATPEDPRSTAYYQNAESIARTSRDNSILDIGYDTRQGANQLGFSYNADTYGTDFAVDPSNPFSKMALLQRSYEQQKSGTTNSYASMGQLHSGAYDRMKAENQFQNDAGNQSLRDALQALLEGARRGTRDAGATYNGTISTAALDALNQNLGA